MVKFRSDWYENHVRNTDEKEILASKVKEMLSGDERSFLEIGMGRWPIFSQKLAKQFKEYIIVEDNEVEITLPSGASLVNQKWEDYKPPQQFDIVLASHSIYYMHDQQESIDRMFDALADEGKLILVTTGRGGHYGLMKKAFANRLGKDYRMHCDKVLDMLEGRQFKTEALQTEIGFKSNEHLYEILRLSFDNFPKEYESHKAWILGYLSDNVPGRHFAVEHQVIEARK